MKLSTLLLATSMIVAPAIAFAQSQPAPANQTGPSVSPTTQQPTDQGAGNETGNTKAAPSGSMEQGSSSMSPSTSGTTGAGTGSMSGPTTGGSAGSMPDPEAKKK